MASVNACPGQRWPPRPKVKVRRAGRAGSKASGSPIGLRVSVGGRQHDEDGVPGVEALAEQAHLAGDVAPCILDRRVVAEDFPQHLAQGRRRAPQGQGQRWPLAQREDGVANESSGGLVGLGEEAGGVGGEDVVWPHAFSRGLLAVSAREGTRAGPPPGPLRAS